MGVTTAEPEIPDVANPNPVHDEVLLDDQLNVEDCPAVIDLGLAASDAVGVGGGVVKEPAVTPQTVVPQV